MIKKIRGIINVGWAEVGSPTGRDNLIRPQLNEYSVELPTSAQPTFKNRGKIIVVSRQALAFTILMTFAIPAFAYLDPGTGSVILQGILAAIAGIFAAVKLYFRKLKNLFKRKKPNDSRKKPRKTKE